ncbi:ABC transporter ATP-binding protein [Halobacillus salinarum]|uniref:ABC transporter ATP-binding protein n=1 Tax=Halobacillus salinarum TaxID=2932257 RepID=A0ABY4ELN7_9BACI|nr:ABC transporter ATP-binding protein [Halobacillus salinarum]UOQ44507.1 ABC transporter ATP-binding protein [Halobacillus salinarum]
MIEINHVHKSFEKTEALNDVTFQIQEGSIYGLLGSNGAGKTTLLRMMAGIIKQNTGDIHIEGQPIFENLNVKSRLVFLPDAPFFFSQYTTKQMAKYFENVYPNWSQERYSHLQELFQLDENKKISQFSKGMQRQVSFWLAMSIMPDVLILDEPFDGLDAVVRRKVKNLIVQDVADRSMTVVISSHNLREVEDICDHIGILHQGKLLLERELDDLKSDIHKVQVAFKGDQEEEFEKLNVLYKEKRGSVYLVILRGEEEKIEREITAMHPVLYDRLPLTLEEIFIYEMGGAGYAIENIMV